MLKGFRVILISVMGILLASCSRDTVPFTSEKDDIPDEPEKTEETLVPKEPLPVETGLPVMIVSTKGSKAINSKTEWVEGSVRILDREGYVVFSEMTCQLRGRGNSTWGWPKKPYSLKLDEKTAVLGMPAQKHWVLLANYMDRTLMRDALGFHIAEQTSLAWTPRCRYVELVLNGKHVGNYLLAEQVRPDSNRVPIDKSVSGSWLFESDFHYDEAWQFRLRNIPFCVKYPDDEDMSDALSADAVKYLNGKLAACWSGDYSKVAAELDLQSFADYWIVFEVMGNHELRNPGSVFTYASAGGKWTAGPVWDFDWGGLSYYTSPQARTGLINRSAVWYEGLHGIKKYRLLLADRWKTLKPSLEKCVSFIDETMAYLEESDKLNRAMWDPSGAGGINGDERLSFQEAAARLKNNYLERIAVISSIIEDGEF